MKKLIFYEDGEQAIVENVRIERSSPVAEEIRLDTLAQEEQDTILKNRRNLTLERDSRGKLEAVRIGKRRVEIPRNG
jgi:hypothetical protein